jgi:hypothetical protein
MRAMETTPAASLDMGKEQGNRTVGARSEGQSGDSLRRECVTVKRRQQETLVGLHTVPMRLL